MIDRVVEERRVMAHVHVAEMVVMPRMHHAAEQFWPIFHGILRFGEWKRRDPPQASPSCPFADTAIFREAASA